MDSESKNGCLIISISRDDKIIIDDFEIEVTGQRSKRNIPARLKIAGPRHLKITKVKKETKQA